MKPKPGSTPGDEFELEMDEDDANKGGASAKLVEGIYTDVVEVEVAKDDPPMEGELKTVEKPAGPGNLKVGVCKGK